MARVTFQFRTDPGGIAVEVGGASQEAAQRAGEATAARMRSNIQADGLVASGELLNSVAVRPGPSRELHPSVVVGPTAKHAKFLEDGTRAHGPSRAKVMRFKPKGSSGFVFARWVRGVRAYRFASRTSRELSLQDYL